VHEIRIFFLVSLPEHHTIYLHETEFEGTEEGFVNKSVSIDCHDDYILVPEVVVPELKGVAPHAHQAKKL
jgi:hypothetical protein